MLPQQSYNPRQINQVSDMLPRLRPDLFGALPQEGPPQAGGTQGGPPPPAGGSGGGEPPMDMNKYLIDKVMEIKARMGSGEGMGALSAISEAAMQPPQQPPQQQPPQQQPPQQPPMRA